MIVGIVRMISRKSRVRAITDKVYICEGTTRARDLEVSIRLIAENVRLKYLLC